MNMGVMQKLCRESGYDRNKHVNGLVKRWIFCQYMRTYGHVGNVYSTILVPVQRKVLMHNFLCLEALWVKSPMIVAQRKLGKERGLISAFR